MIFSLNNQIACTPFEKKAVELEAKKGFATVKNKTELVTLKVVFGGTLITPSENVEIPAGTMVWVRGESVKSIWGQEEFEVDGTKFILVPMDQLKLVKVDDE